MPHYEDSRRTLVPWQVEQSDLERPTTGLSSHGRNGERYMVLPVVSSCGCKLSLGLLALCCQKKGDDLVPVSLKIEPPDTVSRHSSAMDMTLLSSNEVWR